MTRFLLGVAAVAALTSWLRGPDLVGVAAGALAVGAVALLVRVWRRSAHPTLEAGWEKVRPVSASSRTARRRGKRRRVQDGLASQAEIRAVASARAVRRTTVVLRPQLVADIVRERPRAKRSAVPSRLELLRHVRTTDVGIRLCRVGRRQWVWASLRHVVLHFAGPGAGKALALDTPIPVPGGWTTMGELRDGDELFDDAGRRCRVVQAHPVRVGRPCYEVVFSDGSVIVADGEHLWQVETRTTRKHGTGEKVMTTEEMSHHVRVSSDCRLNYSVRTALPLVGADANLPIPPYTLGAWLGDGHNRGGMITLGRTKAAVLDNIRADGYELTMPPSSVRATSAAYNVTNLIGELRAAGLRRNKHIPPAYFRGSEAQRRALLAGLLDTDGYCSRAGSVEFYSTSERLARDVRQLVATLGYVSTIRCKPARLYGKDCGTSWTVTFCPSDPVFRLARKADRQSSATRASNSRRFIVAIRPVRSVPVRCITVDSPTSLYLAGGQCIPTHNSGWLADRIAEFRGSMVVTSVRPDLYMNTREVRARRGPVLVFNAAGLSNIPHEVTFDPLTDCVNPEAAGERARDMIPEAHGEAEHWAGLARGVLAALMHAAALGGHTMDTVLQWVAKPTEHQATIVKLLRRSAAPAKLEAAEQFLTNNEKTRSSITTSIMPALDWLSSPTARAAAGLDGDRRPFRAETLLAGDTTVYVIGRVDVYTEPLLAALTGYVGRAARRAAVTSDRGRIDPPLGLALDEAARFQLPLPDWTSDMGGSGVPIIACFQSLAQLVGVYGQDRADEILNNAGGVLLGGGTKAAHDLDAWTKLAGERDELTSTTDAHGKATGTSQRSTPVLPAAVLANLAPQEVAVWRTGMPPALGRTRMVWERWDLHPPLPLRLLQAGWRAVASRIVEVETSLPTSSPPPSLPPTERLPEEVTVDASLPR